MRWKIVGEATECRIVSSQEYYDNLKDKTTGVRVVKTGFSSLDNHIGGIYGGEVTVITGPTKNGKTLLAATITDNLAKKGENCLWFPYEVSGLRFLKVFDTPLPKFYLPEVLRGKSLAWILDRIRDAKKEREITAVFIDHLHYLVDFAMMNNTSLEIGAIMRRLHEISEEEDVHIFLIAHMRKVNDDRDPRAGDVRDSSFIEQESDNCLAICRGTKPETKHGNRIWIIHNRRLGVRDEWFDVEKVGPYLREPTDRDEPPKKTWGET